MCSWTNIWGGHPSCHFAHLYCIGCLLMLKQQGEKSMIKPFARAGDSPPPNETCRQGLLPWNLSGLGWPGRRSGRCTTRCINWRGHPAWTHVMQRWWGISTRKSSNPSRSTSVTGRITPSQQRNQGKDPPVLPGQPPSASSSRGSVCHMSTLGI